MDQVADHLDHVVVESPRFLGPPCQHVVGWGYQHSQGCSSETIVTGRFVPISSILLKIRWHENTWISWEIRKKIPGTNHPTNWILCSNVPSQIWHDPNWPCSWGQGGSRLQSYIPMVNNFHQAHVFPRTMYSPCSYNLYCGLVSNTLSLRIIRL